MTDTTPLSPAAQAVFWAFNSKFEWIEDGVPGPQFQAIAAALRAAAHEVAPFPGRYPMNEWMEGFRDAKQSVHHQFLAIAAELEGAGVI